MHRDLGAELEFIIEKTPAEWKALAQQIKSQPVKKPELDLFNVKGAAAQYLKGPKAAYDSVSGGLEKGASGLAKKVGFSPETAANIGDFAGGPGGMAVAGGVAVAGAAAAIYAGYKIYKNYISKAGVACKNSPNRRRCELEYQIKGKKAQAQAILDGHHKCTSTDCYKKLEQKERQLRRDVDNLKKKLSKVQKYDKSERNEDEIFKGKPQTSK